MQDLKLILFSILLLLGGCFAAFTIQSDQFYLAPVEISLPSETAINSGRLFAGSNGNLAIVGYTQTVVDNINTYQLIIRTINSTTLIANEVDTTISETFQSDTDPIFASTSDGYLAFATVKANSTTTTVKQVFLHTMLLNGTTYQTTQLTDNDDSLISFIPQQLWYQNEQINIVYLQSDLTNGRNVLVQGLRLEDLSITNIAQLSGSIPTGSQQDAKCTPAYNSNTAYCIWKRTNDLSVMAALMSVGSFGSDEATVLYQDNTAAGNIYQPSLVFSAKNFYGALVLASTANESGITNYTVFGRFSNSDDAINLTSVNLTTDLAVSYSVDSCLGYFDGILMAFSESYQSGVTSYRYQLYHPNNTANGSEVEIAVDATTVQYVVDSSSRVYTLILGDDGSGSNLWLGVLMDSSFGLCLSINYFLMIIMTLVFVLIN